MKRFFKWLAVLLLFLFLLLIVIVLFGGFPGLFKIYKMPTADMEPLLYGDRYFESNAIQDERPNNKMLRFFKFGEKEIQITAETDGHAIQVFQPDAHGMEFKIGEIVHPIPKGLTPSFRPNLELKKGDLMAQGIRKEADRLFVNQTSYWFASPKRGDLVVFKSGKRRWVKRIAGLPTEKVSIHPPYLFINGKEVVEPKIFKTISSGEKDYNGYKLANILTGMTSPLTREEDEVVLGDQEFFVLGDNPSTSKDSRHFGPIKKKDIVGKVVRISWPLDRKTEFDDE